MSFREKSAWISLLLYLGVYGYYAWRLYGAVAAGQAETIAYGNLLARLVVLLIIVQSVLHAAVAIAKPKDAMAPKDEREKLIDLKATQVAFYVASIGALGTCLAIALGAPSFYTVNGLFLAVVLAEVVRSAGQIVLFRASA